MGWQSIAAVANRHIAKMLGNISTSANVNMTIHISQDRFEKPNSLDQFRAELALAHKRYADMQRSNMG